MSKRHVRDDVDKLHDYHIYIPSRTIWMGAIDDNLEDFEPGTDFRMAETVIKNLTILESISKDPITIIMNNPGGDVYHGLAIYDAIKACESQVTVKVFGSAMSMGSIILQAADERIMSPNSVQMVHYGYIGAAGHVKTVYRHIEEGKRIDSWMENMYLEKIREKIPDFSKQRLSGMINHDCFFTAAKSVEFGLADKILGEK